MKASTCNLISMKLEKRNIMAVSFASHQITNVKDSYLCKEKGFIKIFDRDLPTKDVMMAPEQDATICWSGVMPLLAKGAELWPFMLPSWNINVQFEIISASTYNTLVLTILVISRLFYTTVVTECDVITSLQCYTITSVTAQLHAGRTQL